MKHRLFLRRIMTSLQNEFQSVLVLSVWSVLCAIRPLLLRLSDAGLNGFVRIGEVIKT